MEKNTVVINKKISTITKALEVNGDIIVPDIKPDIVNIINTNGIPYIYKEDISNGRLRLDGNIDTYVVYLADTGETRSIQTTLSFSEIVEEKGITEKSIVKEKIILELFEQYKNEKGQFDYEYYIYLNPKKNLIKNFEKSISKKRQNRI